MIEPGSPNELVNFIPEHLPRDIWICPDDWLIQRREGPEGPWHAIVLLVTSRPLTTEEKRYLRKWTWDHTAAIYKIDWEFAVYDRT